MNAKEKAKELVNKYFDLKWQSYSRNKTSIKQMSKLSSKKCALICVDEILQLPCLTDEAWLNVEDEYKVQYWKEVKEEIINYDNEQ